MRRAVRDLDVGYPVVIDDELAIWRAFENRCWPALYLVDGDGRVGFRHFGEGAYEESELAIEALLHVDVDESGDGTLSEPRRYQLVRRRGPTRERTFEITFEGARRTRVRLHLRLIRERLGGR